MSDPEETRAGAVDTPERSFRVYFACVGNSGRSQMAEALCREMGGDAVECASGGSDPYGKVLDHVRTAMAEIGIPMLGYESTPLDPAFVEEADLVVTMGCGEDACPAFHNVELVDWELTDPKGQDLATVREIRDEIGRRVRALLEEQGLMDDAPGWSGG